MPKKAPKAPQTPATMPFCRLSLFTIQSLSYLITQNKSLPVLGLSSAKHQLPAQLSTNL